MLQTLLSVLRPRLSDGGRAWLDREIGLSGPDRSLDALVRACTAAPRHAGRAALSLTAAESAQLAALDPDLTLSAWTIDDAARAVLLLAAAEGNPAGFPALAEGCYAQGDAREQQSWLRALPLLPDPGRFTTTAIDACRTNIVPLFESIACENPFPSRFFPERNFNQLVLKGLFNGIAMTRITGLEARLNPELSRMAGDYVRERRAAGRAVPADIWTVISDADNAALRQVPTA